MVDAGDYTIKCISGGTTPYISPDDLLITVGQDQPISYTRTYKACGFIGYSCYYYDDFGNYSEFNVGWRVTGESEWKNGYYEKYLPGSYNIEFKDLGNYADPSISGSVPVTKDSYNSGSYRMYFNTQIYVDVDYGNDNNNGGGSQSRYQTIQKALDMMPDDSFTSEVRRIYVYDLDDQISQDVTFPSNKTLTMYGMEVHDPSGFIMVYGYNNTRPAAIMLSGILFD